MKQRQLCSMLSVLLLLVLLIPLLLFLASADSFRAKDFGNGFSWRFDSNSAPLLLAAIPTSVILVRKRYGN